MGDEPSICKEHSDEKREIPEVDMSDTIHEKSDIDQSMDAVTLTATENGQSTSAAGDCDSQQTEILDSQDTSMSGNCDPESESNREGEAIANEVIDSQDSQDVSISEESDARAASASRDEACEKEVEVGNSQDVSMSETSNVETESGRGDEASTNAQVECSSDVETTDTEDETYHDCDSEKSPNINVSGDDGDDDDNENKDDRTEREKPKTSGKKRKKVANKERGPASSSSKKEKTSQKGGFQNSVQSTLSGFFSKASSVPRLRSRWSSDDTDQYLHGYPGKKDYKHLRQNLEFYMNQIPSTPNGDLIDNIHATWWGDYDLLEVHHGYIQWLFPIRESGMNWDAQELQLHEAKAICADKEAHKRVLRSYEMMLDFYGMELVDAKTGEIRRSANWRSRFAHLNRSMHNYLRITRILKCLGEMDYQHLQAPFAQFCVTEAFEKGTLSGVRRSLSDYWVHVVKDTKAREALIEEIDSYMH